MTEMRIATTADLAWIEPAALQAHIIDAPGDLVAVLEADPWRVRVSGRGEAALLDRWREHTNECAILGLWSAPRRVPPLVADIEALAAEMGFDRLIAPLVPEEAARPYLNAGLHVVERVAIMRRELRGWRPPPERDRSLSGVAVRLASEADIERLVALDAICFDDFWRYDGRILARLARIGRILVAEEEGLLIGYTLATAYGVDGSLGRLAVQPRARRRGVGRLLAEEAMVWLASLDVRSVVLSTQEHNDPSQSLYRSLGFVEVPGRLLACASGPLAGPGEEC